MARMLPEEAGKLVSEWTGQPGRAKSVKRFERSNGLDTALYKNYFYLFLHLYLYIIFDRHREDINDQVEYGVHCVGSLTSPGIETR